jgi:RNA polymerase sigma factor (sigma-70 family)
MELKIYRTREHELIKKCLTRDSAAQQQLFDFFSAKMYALCYRYVRHTMEAEDILVTGFTKVFDRIEQFKGEGSFEGWIRKIIVNEALTYLRKSKTMFVEIPLEHAEQEPNYDDLHHLETEDLLKMISALPTGYRLVFNMYAIDGYSHKEIAEQLGINENTSKSQLSRARVYLQKMLAEQNWDIKQKICNDETATR